MINVSEFYKHNVADTCAVWHLLATARLYEFASREGCKFCLTEYVKYECLDKPRTRLDLSQAVLRERLESIRQGGGFPSYSISMDDLLEVDILQRRKNLGMGELTTIAFAKTTGQATFSDDNGARRLAADVLGQEKSQTTCHLFGWLFYIGRFADADCQMMIHAHEELGGSLGPHLNTAYKLAMQARLYSNI